MQKLAKQERCRNEIQNIQGKGPLIKYYKVPEAGLDTGRCIVHMQNKNDLVTLVYNRS